MSRRQSLVWWLVLSASLGLGVGGCSTAPRGSGGRGGTHLEEVDYSDGGVEERTEAHARFANGVLLELDGDARGAANEFLKAALADAGNEALVLDVSRRLLHDKRYEEGMDLLERATGRPGGSGTLYARKGLIFSLAGKKEEAIGANREAIRRAPDELTGYQHLAQIYLQEGNAAAAIKVLERARALGTDDPIMLQKMAEAYWTLGKAEESGDLYVELLERLPGLPGAREKLIELYLRKQDHVRAAELLEKLLKDNPTNPQAHYFLGAIAFEQGDSARALEHLQKAVLLNPDMEQAYYDMAGAQLNLNRPKDALRTLGRARERFQQSFLGELYSGLSYFRMQDFTNALTRFTSAEVIARATDTNRLTHTLYFQMGMVYERCGQADDAVRYFQRCLELNPEFSEAMNYLGYMWAEQGVNLEEAHRLIDKALAMEPENAAYLDSLGWVLYKMGKNEEALAYILEAVAKSKEPDPTLYDHLGDIYLVLNQRDEARQAWEKSLSGKPDKGVQEKLNKIMSDPVEP